MPPLPRSHNTFALILVLVLGCSRADSGVIGHIIQSRSTPSTAASHAQGRASMQEASGFKLQASGSELQSSVESEMPDPYTRPIRQAQVVKVEGKSLETDRGVLIFVIINLRNYEGKMVDVRSALIT
ncbi:hypothetical protein HETIRDRAFT_120313 [Heterobasidion irregulare TC 32-1]|uniref:Uncharacterized protein n=1 Tax=Heterobasidion irregulare (strain TC 32-1) TaxID=747525 RepID=W4JNZ7_HETIT|nr:uncharacterized protein HETIRDRAFT_120313 [Heterobasidion irregulare TC 32-1]ETW75272.1 hypothetical protein HETIRDRAFT_120313 [Heterobasidion irregulare TC 32-1]